MNYKLFASLTVIVHFLFIVFMIAGFLFNFYAVVFKKKLLNYFCIRILHLAGIITVFSLEALGKYCPLTLFENYLHFKARDSFAYEGSFIIHYLEKIIYPDVNPAVIIIPTGVLTAVTLLIFIFYPPKKKQGETFSDKTWEEN